MKPNWTFAITSGENIYYVIARIHYDWKNRVVLNEIDIHSTQAIMEIDCTAPDSI